MRAMAIGICCALALTSACDRAPRANAAERESAGKAAASEQLRTGCTGANATSPCPPGNDTLNGTTPNRTPEELRQPGSVGSGGPQGGTVGEHGGPQRGIPPGR